MANTRKSNSIEAVSREVETLLRRCVNKDQRVAIAYSGGMDSSVLLHCIAGLRGTMGIHLSTIHIHHGLSPNADLWAAHCEQQAKVLEVAHTTIRVEVDRYSDDGLEASARRQRYAAFAKQDVDWVVLGHHLDDQAETVMHNLLRGAGVMGMAAMPAVRGRLLRPLLAIPREQLHNYAIRHQLKWCEDESNRDFRLTRNHIRANVLPLMKQRYPATSTQLAAAASRFADAQASLDDLAMIDAGAALHTFPFPVAAVASLNVRRGCNLLRFLLAQANQQSPAHSRLVEFVRQLLEAGPDRHPQLDFGDCTLRVKHRQILLERRQT